MLTLLLVQGYSDLADSVDYAADEPLEPSLPVEGTTGYDHMRVIDAVFVAPAGVAQLTGVWTRDDLRGRGVATAALATTVDRVRAEHLGPDGIVSLYVNDFNTPAIGLYSGLGFERVGTYATVLL